MQVTHVPDHLAPRLPLGLGVFVLLRRTLVKLPRAYWPWLGAAVLAGGVIGPVLLMVGLTVRADDFFTGDATYFELGRSLSVDGTYGFDAQPIPLPPGFPALLAFALN